MKLCYHLEFKISAENKTILEATAEEQAAAKRTFAEVYQRSWRNIR